MATAFALIATLFVVWLVVMPIVMDRQQNALEPKAAEGTSQLDISRKADQSKDA